MSTVHQRALQSVKAFRVAELNRPIQPKDIKRTKDLLRQNPFLVTRAPIRSHKIAKELKAAADADEEIVQKFRTYAPRVSLRRQADLIKKANMTNTLHLLPPSPKVVAEHLRQKRVREALTPSHVDMLEAARVPVDHTIQLEERLRALELGSKQPIAESKKELVQLQARADTLKEEIEEFEVMKFVDVQEGSLEMQTYNARKAQLAQVQKQISSEHNNIAKVNIRVRMARKAIDAEKVRKENNTVEGWMAPPIKWVGDVSEVKTPGEELGIRLYAGKKRMFKGHLWERQMAGRVRKRAVLMRDMEARVQRYKEYYKKRKPNPLKPSRFSKPPKLPF